MHVLTEPEAMRRWTATARTGGCTVALVPTMGALHAGHLALVDEARDRCDTVVVSIFVNPLQFDRRDDFDSYPRPVDADLARCRELGVDAAYVPTAAVMYPEGFDTRVEPGALATVLEGAHRPGHFTGVTTVVTKLLAAVRPDVAVFGEKDAQQLAVVRRTVTDLDLGVEIVGVPTVREPDGLALSSRNTRLDPSARAAATCLPRSLAAARDLVRAGERSAAAVEGAVRAEIDAEIDAGSDVRLEYATVVDRRTFEPVTDIDEHSLVVLAAWVGGVRLIDNLAVLADVDDDAGTGV